MFIEAGVSVERIPMRGPINPMEETEDTLHTELD